MSRLVIRSGPQVGTEFPLEKPVVVVGRGSSADVVLQSTQASRRHAEISRRADGLYIRDLGSTNGTFVNNERLTAPRLLQPGDQVRIGDVVLGYEVGAAAAMPAGAAAAGPMVTEWEADLYEEETAGPTAAGGRSNLLIWGLVGVVALLLVAVGVAAVFVLKGKGTPTAEAGVTALPTSHVVVAPTGTQAEGGAVAAATATPLVEAPTVEVEVPTVELQATAPVVKSPEAPTAPSGVPTSLPVAPENLEQLPAMVQQYLGDVPPDQLPQVISEYLQNMSPEEAQAMIGALFPGVDPAQLPQVIAASFPGLPQDQLQALLGQVFPGQSFQLPTAGGPVGGRLAVGLHREGAEIVDLYLVNAMGGQQTLVIEQGQEPGFSPDGQWLAYRSTAPDRLGLRLIKVDGTGDTALTPASGDSYPSFSPDGQRIVFYSGEQNSIVIINRDGSNRREITKGEYPAWSPTGDQIVYRGCIGGGKCGLIVANADGSNPRQITTHANDAAPRWSPNGGQIVFHSDRDGNWEIYVINSDGSWLRRITNKPATDVMPVWSPDGLRIAFLSDRGGKQAVYTTSGIGGGAIKQFEVKYPTSVGPWLKLDWGK